MAENRKKKDRQKVPWWLTPVILLAVLAIRSAASPLRGPMRVTRV